MLNIARNLTVLVEDIEHPEDERLATRSSLANGVLMSGVVAIEIALELVVHDDTPPLTRYWISTQTFRVFRGAFSCLYTHEISFPPSS